MSKAEWEDIVGKLYRGGMTYNDMKSVFNPIVPGDRIGTVEGPVE